MIRISGVQSGIYWLKKELHFLFCIVDPQIQKPAFRFYFPLKVRVGLCRVVKQRADVNVSTLTLNFALYKCELKILMVFINFSISVVHKGRGVRQLL